jgi:hypothetical protein
VRWHLDHPGELALAVVPMLSGAVMLFTDVNAGIAFPLIAVGLALTALYLTERRRGGASH